MEPNAAAAALSAFLKAIAPAAADDASDPNPFGDIGNPTTVAGLTLETADLSATRRIANGIDTAIATSDQAKLNALLAAVQPFIAGPAGLLESLGGLFV